MKKIYVLQHKGPTEHRWKYRCSSSTLFNLMALYHYYRKNTPDRSFFRVVSYVLTEQKVISKSP